LRQGIENRISRGIHTAGDNPDEKVPITAGVVPDFVRMSVGIEESEDLRGDIVKALN
jgi:O-acetylhomoserine/O-acetylserine sulfhydrylase-like pyridoxal-dependent enzyme